MSISDTASDAAWGKMIDAYKAQSGKSRGEAVFDILKQALREGLLLPGNRLIEDEIAEKLNVSRTPVREALNRLIERQLVEPAGGRGLIIRRLSNNEATELYAMREIMEGAAAHLAAQNATAAEIDVLYILNDSASKDGLSATEYAILNKKFHDAIIDAARNRYLYDPLEFIRESLILLGPTTFIIPGRLQKAHDEHQTIIDAIAARDPAKAEELARQHIKSAFKARLFLLNS